MKIPCCPACGTEIGYRFIVLNAGALLRTGPDSASMDDRLWGFFHVNWHDHDNIGRPHVDIPENSVPGQIELLFCGPDCLRQWFNGIVDRLEEP